MQRDIQTPNKGENESSIPTFDSRTPTSLNATDDVLPDGEKLKEVTNDREMEAPKNVEKSPPILSQRNDYKLRYTEIKKRFLESERRRKEDIVAIKSNYEKLESRQKEIICEKEKTIATLNKENEELKEKVKSLRKEIKSTNEELERKNSTIASMTIDIVKLQNDESEGGESEPNATTDFALATKNDCARCKDGPSIS